MKTRFDFAFFSFGGIVFGLASVVLTVHALKSDSLPSFLVSFLTWLLVTLCVLSVAMVLFRRKLIKSLTGVEPKTLLELIDEMIADEDKEKALANVTFSDLGRSFKGVLAWYFSIVARRELVRAVVTVVGGVALFLSASVIMDQLAEMKKQNKNLTGQLEELRKQNENFEHQITNQEKQANTSRVTELVKLLYEDPVDVVVKAMALRELLGMDSPYLDLQGVDLENIKAQGLNLSNKNITETNLRRANLEKVNFSGSDLRLSVIREAEMSEVFALSSGFNGCDLSGASMGHGTYTGADFNSVLHERPKRMKCVIPGVSSLETGFPVSSGRYEDIRNSITNMKNVSSFHDRFSLCKMDSVDFNGANLRGTCFIGARGEFVNFDDAYMHGVDFTNSVFKYSVFDSSELFSVRFVDADLTQSSFRGATMINVYFNDAKLNCVDFTDVNIQDVFCLDGADLRKANGLTDSLLAKACGSEKTRFSEKGILLKKCEHDEVVRYKESDYLNNLDWYVSLLHFEDPVLRNKILAYLEKRFER